MTVPTLQTNRPTPGANRMESFNFTNTPHFNNPGGTYGNSSFGQVTGAASDQREIQFALKIMF